MKLKIAYFGTPDFAARFLEKIILDKSLPIEIVLVVTQPDRPVGRNKILTPSPVKQVANKYGTEVLTNLQETRYKIQETNIDLALILFYGQMIPADVLKIPKYGFWNIHFSFLPQYRGPIPAAFSIIMGDQKTAVSIVQTDEKLDHGPLIAQIPVDIKPDETRLELEARLTDISYDVVTKQLDKLVSTNFNQFQLIQQDHSLATYTLFPTKQHGFIPLPVLKKALKNEPLTENETPSIIKEYLKKNNIKIKNLESSIYNLYRGLSPWPGLWTLIQPPGLKSSTGKPRGLLRLKLTKMSLKMLHASRFTLHIERVQLEGKTEVPFADFNRVYKIL